MNNRDKAAFLTKPNIATSQTGEHANLTFGQLTSGNETWRGEQHNRTESGFGIGEWSESPSGSEQHPADGAPIQRSRSFQGRLDRYVKEHERQLSFSDSPSPPYSSSPTNIQYNVPRNSNSDVPVFDPASGGAPALAHSQRSEGDFGVLQYCDHISSSSTGANPPPGMPHPSLQNNDTSRQTAYSSGIPTIPGNQSLFMQPNGLLEASTMGTHHMMVQLPAGAPPWNLPYVNHQYGPFMNPYPYSVQIHQQSDQTHFATGVHIPQNGYQQGFLPPFGVPQIAPTASTTLHQISPPDSKQHSPAVKNPQPAAKRTQTPGSVHLAPNGRPSLPVGVAQNTTASSSTSLFTASAPSSGHEIARSAPTPNPRLAPTPARTPAAPNSPAATIKSQLYPEARAPLANDILDFPQAKPNLLGSVVHGTSQTQPKLSGGNEGQKASRDVHPKVPEHPHQHTYPAGVNRSNEEESGNSVEVPNNDSHVPPSQPPSPNGNSAAPTGATQTAKSNLGDLDNSNEPRETAIGSGVDSQTESCPSQGILARASTALAAKSNWADQDPSKPPVERPLTKAERFAMKLAKAELAEDEKEDSKEDFAMIQAPMPLHSDAAQWPSLSESSLVGKKGKSKKGIKGDLKPGADPGSGSGPRLQYLPAGARAQVDWNIIRPQMTTELKCDIFSRPETNANPKDNSYFTSTGSAPLAKDKDSLAKLFEKYRDPKGEEDKLDVNGTLKYLQDLGLNIETAEIFVPLEIIQAPSLSDLPKDGFVDGWKKLDADTIAKQRAYVAGQVKQLSVDMALFKRVYRHAFVCSRDSGQKALQLDAAIIYWELVFNPPGKQWVTGTGSATTNWLSLWVEFLKANWTKTVNKDMWNQLFEFFLKTMQDETLSFWSEDGAWPGVIDDFVAYVKEKRGDLPDTMETD